MPARPHKNALTIVMAGGEGRRLAPLTREVAKPAVRFGGQYRIIDFTLSNCINSNLRRVLVLTQYKSLLLERHIKEAWNFFDRRLDEYVDVVPPQQRIGTDWYRGTADAIYQNYYSIDEVRPRDLVILSGDHIYKMDYRQMLRVHRDQDAAVTIATLPCPASEAYRFGILAVGEGMRVSGFREKPKSDPPTIPGREGECLANMGVYVFQTALLRRYLDADAADPTSAHDFGQNVLPTMVAAGERVVAFPFVDMNGKPAGPYWRDVGTVASYYEANMDLVDVDPLFNLYDRDWPVYTHHPQVPPPKFVFAQEEPGGRCGRALDSIVASGSIVSGGRVERSVLSFFSRVDSYADVRQALLFDGARVRRRCKVFRAILDVGAELPEGVHVGYDRGEDEARFHVSPFGDDGWVTVVTRENAAALEK